MNALEWFADRTAFQWVVLIVVAILLIYFFIYMGTIMTDADDNGNYGWLASVIDIDRFPEWLQLVIQFFLGVIMTAIILVVLVLLAALVISAADEGYPGPPEDWFH
jgi:hypothetical protein